jgi:hypothetical protein
MRTLDDPRKLLRRVDREGFAETSREDGRLAHVDLGASRVGGGDGGWGAAGVGGVGGADVDEGEAEPGWGDRRLVKGGEGRGGGGGYRKWPSVRTERSCRTNQMPIRSSGSVRRKAEADKLPIRLRVNMPVGCELETGIRWTISPGVYGRLLSGISGENSR